MECVCSIINLLTSVWHYSISNVIMGIPEWSLKVFRQNRIFRLLFMHGEQCQAWGWAANERLNFGTDRFHVSLRHFSQKKTPTQKSEFIFDNAKFVNFGVFINRREIFKLQYVRNVQVRQNYCYKVIRYVWRIDT